MRNRIFVLIIVALVAGMCSAGYAAGDVKASGTKVGDYDENVYEILWNQADMAIDAGDFEGAVARIKDALKVDPENKDNKILYTKLGLIYGYLDQDSLALESLTKAYECDTTYVPALEYRANLYGELGDDMSAYADFGRIIEIDSCHLEARYYHGIISVLMGEIEAAERDIVVLESFEPEEYRTLATKVLLLDSKRAYAEAVPYYKKLLAMGAKEWLYEGLALCYLKLGELAEARPLITEWSENFPDDGNVYYYRAWVNRDSYRMDDAKYDAKRAKEMGVDPEKVDMLFW